MVPDNYSIRFLRDLFNATGSNERIASTPRMRMDWIEMCPEAVVNS